MFEGGWAATPGKKVGDFFFLKKVKRIELIIKRSGDKRPEEQNKKISWTPVALKGERRRV